MNKSLGLIKLTYEDLELLGLQDCFLAVEDVSHRQFLSSTEIVFNLSDIHDIFSHKLSIMRRTNHSTKGQKESI